MALDPETVIVLRAAPQQQDYATRPGLVPPGVGVHWRGRRAAVAVVPDPHVQRPHQGDRAAAGAPARPAARRRDADAAGGAELKTIADQLGHSSVVLTADTYISVAIELGLKAAARRRAADPERGQSPPGGGSPAGAAPAAGRHRRLTTRHAPHASKDRRATHLPQRPGDPDNADPARQPGIRHARKPQKKRDQHARRAWSHIGPTLAPPATQDEG